MPLKKLGMREPTPKPWVEAAKRRLHHNVPALALANKLARIAWAVLNKERNFEWVKTSEMASRSA
jgi:transposase